MFCGPRTYARSEPPLGVMVAQVFLAYATQELSRDLEVSYLQ